MLPNSARTVPAPVVYPESDGQPMVDNTRQLQWIAPMAAGFSLSRNLTLLVKWPKSGRKIGGARPQGAAGTGHGRWTGRAGTPGAGVLTRAL